MPESELAKRVNKAIKAADRLVRDIRKDAEALLEAARKLRDLGKD